MGRWQGIKSWPYEVSNRGRVRRTGRSSGTRPGLVLVGEISSRGYRRVLLQHGGQRKKHTVHRLVAVAFLEHDPDRLTINHINGDQLDNRVENLEWCTQSENQLHAYRTGLQLAGEHSGRAKLTQEQVGEIRRRYAKGETQTALAREFPVNQSMISKIVRREFWR